MNEGWIMHPFMLYRDGTGQARRMDQVRRIGLGLLGYMAIGHGLLGYMAMFRTQRLGMLVQA